MQRDGVRYFGDRYSLRGNWLAKVSQKDIDEAMHYRPLIAKYAWTAYRKLPLQARVWIGIEELVNEGVIKFLQQMYLCRSKKDKYDFAKCLGGLLVQHYTTVYIDPMCRASKRFKVWTDEEGNRQEFGRTVSIDNLVAGYAEKGMDFDIERVLGLKPPSQGDTVQDCVAVDALLKIHKQSSDVLKAELVKWFLKSDGSKLHLYGFRFMSAKKEFQSLAKESKFTIQDARHIVASDVCLDLLSRSILEVPHDLDNPYPAVRRSQLAVPVRFDA